MANAPTATSEDVSHLPRTAYAPFDPAVELYFHSRTNMENGYLVPLEYSGWRNEVTAWKERCTLHSGLNPAFTYRVKGRDALRLFSDICVNGFNNFRVGTLKHAIMCNDGGLVVGHGVLSRVEEDEFISHFLAHWIDYKLKTGKYDAIGEFINDGFVFQVAGPRSLETLEAAAGECLHDIRFGGHRMAKIGGMDVRVLRMGMAGNLAYEVHGRIKEVRSVYASIIDAGRPFGIAKLGRVAYQMHHTEAGFPQMYVHFPAPFQEEKGFMDYYGDQARRRPPPDLAGSMGTDIRLRYRNPIELGWAKTVRFDHEFIGRKALEKEAANPRRQMVTLAWNPDDITDVYASQFRPGEPYMPIEFSFAAQHKGGVQQLHADQVMKNGRPVGVSSGRIYSYTYRQMISLCSIDTEHSARGTEVSVLWGAPGSRQKEIRSVVSRFPYLDQNRNEQVDVGTIPCIRRN